MSIYVKRKKTTIEQIKLKTITQKGEGLVYIYKNYQTHIIILGFPKKNDDDLTMDTADH